MSAPSRSQASSFSRVLAVTATRAPNARAICTAMVPMPLDPPWTSKVSPAVSLANWNTFDHTVRIASGSPAASTRSTLSGTGSTWAAGATAREA